MGEEEVSLHFTLGGIEKVKTLHGWYHSMGLDRFYDYMVDLRHSWWIATIRLISRISAYILVNNPSQDRVQSGDKCLTKCLHCCEIHLGRVVEAMGDVDARGGIQKSARGQIDIKI